MKRFSLFLLALLVSTTVMWAQEIVSIQGDGTESNPYLIQSEGDWSVLRRINNAGETFKDKYLKVATDFVTDESFVGTFSGTFDGNGHTITAKIINHAHNEALFKRVKGATIRNMQLAGSLEIGRFGAALVGLCDGDLTLENIVVSAQLRYDSGGSQRCGGVIGHAESSTLDLTCVVFCGRIFSVYNEDAFVGGIIGWGDNYTATLNDVLFCGTCEGEMPFTPIACKHEKATVNITDYNSLYDQVGRSTSDANIAAKGLKATIVDKVDELGVLLKDYGLLQVYERGLERDNKYYLSSGLPGRGTVEHPYLIRNVDDWKKAVEMNKGGNTFYHQNLKVTSDFTTDLCMDKTFSGIFDGDGHTITATIDDTQNLFTALFRSVKSATIRNLRMAGDMKVTCHGGALVGGCDGDLTLENIVVSTNVEYKSRGGESYGGGVIGHAENSNLQLSGVVYSGKMTATDKTRSRIMGGIIGWGDNYIVEMEDILFCGTYEGETPFTPIAAKYHEATVKKYTDNTLYTQEGRYVAKQYIAAGGYKATLSDKADGCGTLVKDYGPLQVYANGLKFGDTYYLTTGLYGRGTEHLPYLIRSDADWRIFCDKMNDGETLNGKQIVLEADLNINYCCPGVFCGTLDGLGHTISFNVKGWTGEVGLFCHVKGATIRNLKMTGDIDAGKHGAALVSLCDGNLTLKDIVVSTNIAYKSQDGETYGGGIIGHAENSNLQLSGVVYSGKMTSVDKTSSRIVGGIIGWGDNYTATLKDVLFSGTYEGETPFTPIAAKYNEATVKVTAYYALYTQETKNAGDAFIAASGFKANISDKADGCGALVMDYGLLQVYENGFKVGDTYYPSAVLFGHGTEEHPYLISSAADWEKAASYNSGGMTFADQYLKATADFTTGLSFDKTFSGFFDGDGHTISATIDDTQNLFTALFRSVKGATIRNLRMAGDMKVTSHGGALVGGCDGDLTLENIVVSTNVEYKSRGGESYGGGVIGHAENSNLQLSGVVYSGKMTSVDKTSSRIVGGIIGWGDNYKATLKDVLFSGTYEGETPFTPIAAKYNEATVKVTAYNALYTQESQKAGDAFIAVKGDKANLSDMADGCGTLVKDYGLLQAYANGLKSGDTYYITTGFLGNGTEDFPYLIRSADDWKLVIERRNRYNNYENLYLKVTDDFTTDTRYADTFRGHLDGDGHTITANIKGWIDDAALFNRTSNATIRRLHVTGEMELRRHGAGLVSSVDGTLTLEGILVSTAITFKAYDGNTYGGGVIGHANSSTLNLNGVVFSGHLKAADNYKERLLGGIIGWGDNYTATLNNVLFCGTREGETPFVPIAGKWGEGHVTITVNNVFTTEGQYGIGYANNFLVAWEGDKIVARNRVEKLGALTNDFKVVTVYEHGVSVNNKYYGPVWKLFGDGTQADPYIIEENAEWIYIVDQSYKGNTFNNRHLKMMNDISANRHYHGCFKGTFDGGGHTLHYDHMLVPDRGTVFQDVKDATICNLKLTGSMNSASTLIGGCAGTVTLENVVVSTNLERSSDLFEAHIGGIIRWAGNATLNLRGVVFNGNINIKSELWTYVAMYYLAGIISSGDNYTANMRDVIFCGNAYDNNVAFTPIAWANKGTNPKFNFHNVITTKSPVRCGERKPEAPCRKCRIDRTAAHCGNLVKDYGLLQAYDYGIKVGDLYYAYDPMQGQGTAEDPFLITNAEDWEKTATYNSEGSTFTSQHLKVTADFATDKCFEQSFSGNIDFGSHTITANVQNAETEYAALFRNTYDATIRNLKMAGDMTVGKYGAALVGGSDGDLTLENIVVSANVNYKSDNGLYGGGVIGHAGSSTLDLGGVVFTGNMTPMDNHEDELLGGIVGWGDSYTATMKDILFCGTYAGEKIFTPIAAKNDEAAVEATVDNVFYTQRGKNADPEYIAVGGKKAALNDNASNIGSMIFDYGLLQAYESGLGFDGNFYCEETPTGIDEIENGKFSPGECGDGINSENSDAQWFTLDGRKLAGKPTKKGLYIVNGRKAIVR